VERLKHLIRVGGHQSQAVAISALVSALTVALPAITGSVYDERPPLLVDL
jgi:hypothetical protein